jgi:hypothetical protein
LITGVDKKRIQQKVEPQLLSRGQTIAVYICTLAETIHGFLLSDALPRHVPAGI